MIGSIQTNPEIRLRLWPMDISELDDEIRNLFAKAALPGPSEELAEVFRQLRAALRKHVGATRTLATGSLQDLADPEARQGPQ
jgi:hypothetical protein